MLLLKKHDEQIIIHKDGSNVFNSLFNTSLLHTIFTKIKRLQHKKTNAENDYRNIMIR
jgi:hypothetical protein